MKLKNLTFTSTVNSLFLLAAITSFVSCHKKNSSVQPVREQPLKVSLFAPANGVAGATITITGSGFSTIVAEDHVTINGKAATVTAATSTSLSVSIPQGAGTGKIAVTIGAHTTASTDDFVYTYTVNTLAGSEAFGLKNGADTTAQFQDAFGVATDAAGNIYVADSGNNSIRMITPAGVVTTIAGNGTVGMVNGMGQAARFNYPHGLVVDAAGNIYVVDAGNNRIRKISTAGEVSTLAGNGTAGYADGAGKDAEFDFPADIAIDPAGNLYVSDGNNKRIRKITPTGEVSSLGDAIFSFPEGVAIDATGNLYVTDAGSGQIRKVSSAGAVTIFAGTGIFGNKDGAGAEAEFFNPEGIAIDAQGNLFVGDLGNNLVRKITPAGIVSTVAGSSRGILNGPGPVAKFNGPSGIAVDGAGNIYVADSSNSRIRKIQ